MKKCLFLTVLVSAFVFLPFAHAVSAQNEVEDEGLNANEEDINYSYGVVVSHSPAQIVLLEYDYDRDEEIQVTYEVNADTKVENVESLDKLQKDDNVEIYYKQVNGKNVATSIEKEVISNEDTNVSVPEDMSEDVAPDDAAPEEDVPADMAPKQL